VKAVSDKVVKHVLTSVRRVSEQFLNGTSAHIRLFSAKIKWPKMCRVGR